MPNSETALSSWSHEDSLTVIMVSYNTRDLTLAALRTLFEETRNPYMKVVVFDNDSDDGSADAIAEAFPQVDLIRSKDNVGFARANNIVAESAETNWLLLLNPDTEVQNGAVDKLLAFAKAHPDAGIYGGRTVFPDGSLNIASCWQKITLWSSFCVAVGLSSAFPRSSLCHPEAMGSWKRDTVRQVDIVVGCLLMIRRELWNELGGFDLKYFMYGEEADLCLRAAKLGYRPMITPDAQIMHLVGASSKTQANKLMLLAKARATFVRDHWSKIWVPYGLAMIWIWIGLRAKVLKVLAKLAAGRFAAKAALWDKVWRDRHDWMKGY